MTNTRKIMLAVLLAALLGFSLAPTLQANDGPQFSQRFGFHLNDDGVGEIWMQSGLLDLEEGFVPWLLVEDGAELMFTFHGLQIGEVVLVSVTDPATGELIATNEASVVGDVSHNLMYLLAEATLPAAIQVEFSLGDELIFSFFKEFVGEGAAVSDDDAITITYDAVEEVDELEFALLWMFGFDMFEYGAGQIWMYDGLIEIEEGFVPVFTVGSDAHIMFMFYDVLLGQTVYIDVFDHMTADFLLEFEHPVAGGTFNLMTNVLSHIEELPESLQVFFVLPIDDYHEGDLFEFTLFFAEAADYTEYVPAPIPGPEIPIPVAPLSLEGASSWAESFISEAYQLQLLPANLQSNYTAAITRAEFTHLAVALYERARGPIIGRVEFNDTDDVNVQKMGYLEVVGGVGGGNFNPNGTLTRQEAAVIMSRLAAAIGVALPTAESTFADNNQAADWALSAIGQMQASGIMTGVSATDFNPLGTYTREQSIITMVRLWDLRQ